MKTKHPHNSINPLCLALGALALGGLLTVGYAQTNLYEDFESGTLANWTLVSGTGIVPLDVSTGTNKVPAGGNYAARMTNSFCRMYYSSSWLSSITADSFKFTFWYYDDSGAASRVYNEVRNYTGGTYPGGTLNQLLAIGKFNNVTMTGESFDGTKYQARMASGTPNGWFNLNAPGAPSRSTGWHQFGIERGIYGPSNQKVLTFYVDGKPGRVWTNTYANAAWDTLILGPGTGGGAGTTGNAWFDGMQIISGQAYITQDPQSTTASIGDSPTFTISAIGDASQLYYQWRKNGTNISSATDSTYTIYNCQTTNAGSFDVIVTNTLACKTSLVAVLTVNPPLFVTVQPTNLVVNPGDTAIFTTTVTGAGSITYQWNKKGSQMSGQTDSSLTLSDVTTNDTATYTVTVHNGNDPDNTSAPATLLVNTPPVITTIPNKTIAVGTSLLIPVAATDDISVQATPFQNFETNAIGANVMFGTPDYSGTTGGFIDTNCATFVTNVFPAGHTSAQVLASHWNWTSASPPGWLRLTTAGGTVNPNPIIWLTTPLKFDLWASKSLNVAFGVRETESTGPIGSNSGGGSQGIDFVGVTAGGTPPSATNVIPARAWTAVTFDTTNCGIGAFTGTGALDLTTGKGTLEELALLPADGLAGACTIYLDNFISVPTNALAFSLDPGAPAGAAIDQYTGAISFTPSATGVNSFTVRATDVLGLSSTQSFTVTVIALAPAHITGIAGTNLNYSGGAGSQFVLFKSANVAAALSGWTRMATNLATSGTFTIPAVGTSAPMFYRVKSE